MRYLMPDITGQAEKLAESTATVIGAILSLLFRFKAILRTVEDFQTWYRDYFSGDQDRNSLLLIYAIGSLCFALTISPLAFITWPLLLGYYVREMGNILHTDDESKFLENPWRDDRPAFTDVLSLTIDGFKIGVLPTLFGVVMFLTWWNTAGIIDTATDNLFESLAFAVIPTLLVGLAGLVVVPGFVARYADHGRLGPAVANPEHFIRSVLFNRQYLPQWGIGATVVILSGVLVGVVYVYVSPLLIPTLALPLVFFSTLQACGHFALAYKRSVGARVIETEDTDDDSAELAENSYLVPFRNDQVATPDRNRSILALGETGSGKTEAIKLLAYQFQADDDDPFVVFEYKDDFKQFFSDRSVVADGGATSVDNATDDPSTTPSPEIDSYDEDVVMLSLEGSTRIWNVFEEADSKADFEELGRVLFTEHEENAKNPYFPKAARQVFVATMKRISRELDDPTNEDLVSTIQENSVKELYNGLADFSDLQGSAANIDPEASEQSRGVYGHLQTIVGDAFKGDFKKAGEFSIREYMANPDGRTLILDFPIDRGESVKPVFRLLIDWAIRHGLNDDSNDAYFVLDEFQAIPGLEQIERLVNAGRARHAYAILGVQSKAQLYNTYGENQGEAVLSGLAQEILLRPGDEPSIEHVRTRLGRHQRIQLQQGPTSRLKRRLTDRESEYNQYSIQEEYPISEAELQQFDPGEAVIIEPKGWRRGRLFTLDEVRDDIDRVRAGELDPIEVTDLETN
jgi:hypothetical protein